MRKLLMALALALCLVPALAFAADPAKNSIFAYCKTKDECPLRFNTSKDGKYIVNLSMYNRCASLPASYPKVRVRNGKFSKSGSVKNVVGTTHTFEIQGEFVTPKKAVGAYKVGKGGCSAKSKFTAKRTGKVQ